MKSTVLAITVLLFPLMLFAAPADDIAANLVDVLRSDDLSRLTALVDDKESDPHACEELRSIVDRFDCIRIDRYTSAIESSPVSSLEEHVALRIELEGSASLKALWRPEQPLPRVWHIEARRVGRSWRVSRAVTEERRIAAAMAAAPTVFQADKIATSSSDVELLRVISSYADELSRGKNIARFEHARALARRTGDVSTEVDVLRAFGRTLIDIDRPRMLAVCREAEQLARESGSRDDLAAALLTLGAAQWVNGDLESAKRSYSDGADLVDVLDDPTTAMKALQMVLFLNGGYSNPLQTMKTVERQFELATRYAWEEGEELALINRANLHCSLGNLDVARATTLKALRLSRLHGNRRFVALLISNLGALAAGESRYEEAAQQFREALAFTIDDAFSTIELLIRLAGVELTLGHPEEATELLRKAELLNVQDPGQLASIAAVRGKVQLLKGNAATAVDIARAALAELDAAPNDQNFGNRVRIVGLLGRSLDAAGRKDEALQTYRGAISTIETRRNELGADAIGRLAFLADFVDIYVWLVESLVHHGVIDEAFRVSEQMRARGLREAIDESHIDRSTLLSAEERSREEALQAHVVEINKVVLATRNGARDRSSEEQLAQARAELEAFRSELRLAHPAIGRRRLDGAPQLLLPAGAESVAFIEYVIGTRETIAMVVTDDAAIRAVRLPIRRETLERDARELESLLAARSPAYRRAAARMYTALLAPLEKYTRNKSTLAISPDGALWTVPFHALVARDGRYVIDRHAVFYAQSLSLLRDASAIHGVTPPQLLALGNPTVGGAARSTVRSAFRDLSLGPLADAEVEVRKLASLYPPERRRVYYRDAASEAVFKEEAPRVGIIHIAGHALVDDRAPMYSAIVLATHRNDADDGLLEAREIVDLQLNAELAILSACQTARGRIASGEGVIGLSWALFVAGCPTTVVSQWDAESAATAKLMIELHRRLQAGDTTATALRKAQTSVRRLAPYHHPFYWAPFIALGAANRPLTTR